MGLLNLIIKPNTSDDIEMDNDIEEFNQLFDNISFGDLDEDEKENIPESGLNYTKNISSPSGSPSKNPTRDTTAKSSENRISDDLNENTTTDKEKDEIESEDINFALIWNNKGVALSKMGKYSEALEAYERALLLNSDYRRAWNNKGVALSKMGRYAEAIEAFDQILSSGSNYSPLSEIHMITDSNLPTHS